MTTVREAGAGGLLPPCTAPPLGAVPRIALIIPERMLPASEGTGGGMDDTRLALPAREEAAPPPAEDAAPAPAP